MRSMADASEAANLSRFFKTGPGEYGEGDRFLGIRVPLTRSLVKEYRKEVETEDIAPLINSPYHEVRLAGFLLLIEIFNRCQKAKDENGMRYVVDYYLSALDRGNNWDLVDMVAPKILGKWLSGHPGERPLLDELARMEGRLWHQRVAAVANWMIIRDGSFDDTFRVAEILLHHPHDLIHKAVGWMLREVGKRGGKPELCAFLNHHAATMPRTMLRYAIEKFPEAERRRYLTMKQGIS